MRVCIEDAYLSYAVLRLSCLKFSNEVDDSVFDIPAYEFIVQSK